jgi:EmrB/QacA subfamily drug resistance transporter
MNEKAAAAEARMHSLSRRQVFTAFAIILFANFLSSLDQTIVGTAMPRIIMDFGGFEQYTWVTTIYIVTSSAVMPVVGKLTDMYGRKPFFIGGMAIFVIASALCGLSTSMAQIIIFRGLQGIGGGVIMVNSFTIIGDLFPPSEFGKYQGYMSAGFALSSIIGPTVGGYITDAFSWHWIFLINVPLGILTIILFFKYFKDFRQGTTKHSVDYAGLLALVFTVIPAMLALTWGGTEYPWNSPVIIGMFVFSAAMLGLLIFIESHTAEPIIPLSLFKNKIVSVSYVLTFLTGIGMFSPIIFVPLFYQGVLGASATESGNYLMPMMLSSIVGSFASGQLLSRAGGHYKAMGAIGIGIMAVGVFLLSQISPGTSYGVVVAFIIVQGFGVGFQMPVFTIAVQNALPYSMLGVGTSNANFFRGLGGSVGLALLGSIMSSRFASYFIEALPDSVKSSVHMESLTALVQNPQALVNSGAQQQLLNVAQPAGAQAAAVADQLLVTLREALSSAITSVFWISFFILLIAFAIVFFIKEKPLRRSRLSEEEMAE